MTCHNEFIEVFHLLICNEYVCTYALSIRWRYVAKCPSNSFGNIAIPMWWSESVFPGCGTHIKAWKLRIWLQINMLSAVCHDPDLKKKKKKLLSHWVVRSDVIKHANEVLVLDDVKMSEILQSCTPFWLKFWSSLSGSSWKLKLVWDNLQ